LAKDINRIVLSEAIKKHRLGDLNKAFQLYTTILRSDPNYDPAHFMLGNLYFQAGKYEEALSSFQSSCNISPNNENYINGLGKSYIALGKFEEAKKSFEKVLNINPNFVKAHLNLGKLFRKENKLSQAVEFYRRALEIEPLSIAANNNLGNILQEMNKIDEAASCYETILKANPNQAEAHLNLANIHVLKKENEKALEGYKRAIENNPSLYKAYSNIAKLYLNMEKTLQAKEYIQKAININPKDAESLKLLGQLYQALGNHEAAIINLLKSLHINPSMEGTTYFLGLSYNSRGDQENAIKYLKQEIENQPESLGAHYYLAKILMKSPNIEEARFHLDEATRLDPEFVGAKFDYIRLRLDQCDWSNREEDEANFISLIKEETTKEKGSTTIPMLDINYFPISLELQLQAAEHNAAMHSKKTAEIKNSLNFDFKNRDHKKIRIGYVSPDLREHAVGILIYDLFRHHDKSKFEIYAYSLATPEVKDFYTKSIEEGVDHFVDLSKLPFDVSAKRIYQDEIDILIDMAGYTVYSQTEIHAMQPAPIQAQYLGYPSTMGAEFTQYILADPYLITKESEKFYTEKIVYLPHSFFYSPMKFAEREMKRSEFNIPDDAFVFCCFNSLYKLSPEVFSVWMNILKQIPGSLLWLNSASDIIKKNISSEAKSRGVDDERILFAEKLPQDEYMKRFELADLFLDTFYYSAGSTGVSALAAGLPIITFAGDSNASRMAASMLNSAGLPELVCSTIREYEEKALHFARNLEDLKKLKAKLKNNKDSAPLFSPKKMASYLEEAYLKMWENYKAGNPPKNIYIKE